MAYKKEGLNVAGPRIRKIRMEKGLTQEQLVAKCQVGGFAITRAILAQIEAQSRTLTDLELWWFARILKVDTDKLKPLRLPKWQQRRPS